MRFRLIETFRKSSNNIYELYRGATDLENIENSKNALWFSDDPAYAKVYTHDFGRLYKCLVKIENPYVRKGYPTTCPYETFVDLYKPKYEGDGYVPFFHPDGDVRLSKKWVKYFMEIADKVLREKPRKNGNTYEWDPGMYWQVLDYLNAKKARELGYDAIIYEMEGYASDEYCVLYPQKMVLKKTEDLENEI